MFSKLFFPFVFLFFANALNAQTIPPDTVIHAGTNTNVCNHLRHGEESDNGVNLCAEDNNDVPHFLKNVLFNTTTHFSNIELIDHLQKNFYSTSDTWPDRKNIMRFVLVAEDLDFR
jgi:hypothetical protein